MGREEGKVVYDMSGKTTGTREWNKETTTNKTEDVRETQRGAGVSRVVCRACWLTPTPEPGHLRLSRCAADACKSQGLNHQVHRHCLMNIRFMAHEQVCMSGCPGGRD